MVRRLALCWSFIFCLTVPARAADPAVKVDVPVLSAMPSQNGIIDDSWASAATVTLDQDFTNRRHADELTTVRIAQEGGSLDFAFQVIQREAFTESTETNGGAVLSDDYVGVYLSPNGTNGFQYGFFANPRGARYQSSSENSAYTPQWNSTSKRTPGGYSVTLRIPLEILRSGERTEWKAQFVRAVVHANAFDVWSYSERAAGASDPTYFGTLAGIGKATATVRPRPRAQIYALGAKTTRAYGGDTSRLGADLALPVTPTASLVASLHPDYSNVETDQQTISPTAFAHQYYDVRPFFTQASSSFNYSEGSVNGPLLLYTPAIPAIRDGYAIEGTQGPATFAAFDAVGTRRSDTAEAADYNISDQTRSYGVNVQNVNVDTVSGLHDAVSSITTGYTFQRAHLGTFVNVAEESGSAVTIPGAGSYFQSGVGYNTATSTAVIAYSHLGSQFAPADAYVAQNDISGPEGYASVTVPFKANTILHDLSASSYDATFNDHTGLRSQIDSNAQINVDFSNLITVHVYDGQTAVRTYARELLPFDSNGALVGYKFQTSTPTYVEYVGGPYYHGNLDAWTYLSTLQVAPRTHLTLEADEDQYLSTAVGETRTNQWLERASLDVQVNRETQFDIGARRLIGSFLAGYAAPPDFTPVSAGNVSVAFHFLAHSGRSEFYAVYGDPNSLSTTPALFVKYIRYFGAPKGT